jgi:hypothetical protein
LIALPRGGLPRGLLINIWVFLILKMADKPAFFKLK